MTRQLPASALKGHRSCRERPREGSKLRATYDALRRGERVHLEKRMKADLTDYWGLELGFVNGPHGYSFLLGEWEGAEWVPLERILQEDMGAAA